MEKLSLDALAREQLEVATASTHGRAAKTVYGGSAHSLRQTMLALTTGNVLAEHDNPGEATLLIHSGRFRLTAGEVSWEGRTGDLIVVPQARHSLEALESGVVLLTVAKRT